MPEVTHLSWENHAEKPPCFQQRWTFPVEKNTEHIHVWKQLHIHIHICYACIGWWNNLQPPPKKKKDALDSLIPIKSMGLVSTPYMKTHYQIMRNSCRLNIPNSSPWILRNGNLPLWVAGHRGFLRQIFHAALLWSAAGVRLVETTDSHGDEFGRFT